MKKRELLDGQLPVCLNKPVNYDCKDDSKYRCNAEMDRETER